MTPALGIDLRANIPHRAVVSQTSGRPEIVQLAAGADSIVADSSIELAIAIPDDLVLVKSLAMRNGSAIDLGARIRFELVHSVLEPENEFLFDSFKSGLSDRYVGLIYRRDRLEQFLQMLNIRGGLNVHRFLARAAALGRGYMTFCRPEGGELQCVADITRSEVSLCFLYRGEITSLASMRLSGYDWSSPSAPRKLARELKTLVNFKLAGLADLGITIPLSVVILTGEPVDNNLFDILSGFFPIGVASPRFNQACLGRDALHPQPDLFLAALGAAVN